MQRIIVSQINQSNGGDPIDAYGGELNYNVAPWFDWGPYLWADGPHLRNDGLFWCSHIAGGICTGLDDVRYGDSSDQSDFWGDFTHPTATGEAKVAGQLVKWIQNTVQSNLGTQSYISNWVVPWLGKVQ